MLADWCFSTSLTLLMLFSAHWAFAGETPGLPSSSPRVDVEQFSPAETIGSILIEGNGYGNRFNYYRRANPAAAAAVRRILENDELQATWADGILVLAHLGNDQDIQAILSVMSRELTDRRTRRATFRSVSYALGIMARKGSKVAYRTLEEMIAGDRLRVDEMPSAVHLANRKMKPIDVLKGNALHGLSWADKKRAAELSNSLIESYRNDKYFEYKSGFYSAERMWQYLSHRSAVEGRAITEADMDGIHAAYKKTLPELRRLGIIAPLTPEQQKAQAIKAFLYAAYTIENALDPACWSLISFLDRSLAAHEPGVRRRKHEKDLVTTRRILTDLVDGNLITKAALAATAKNSKVTTDQKGNPLVTWPIPNSKHLRAKYPGHRLGHSGDLVIVMKYLNDEWLWCPFGWFY